MLFTAKFSCPLRPVSVAGGDKIADDTTHITLLGGVIVGAGMVPRDSHRPGLMALVEVRQEFCRVFDIGPRLEHGRDRGEILTMIMLVDLHAADIDEPRTTLPCRLESLQGLIARHGEDSPSLDVERIGLERSLSARFRQADGIQDPFRYAIFRRRRMNFPFTGARGCRSFRYRRDQAERRQKCQKDSTPGCCHLRYFR